jgi:hypothetical protein
MNAAPEHPEHPIINLLAALAWPHPPFPAPLATAGFRLWGVEREVSTPRGAVRPDVGLVHPREDHTLLLEVKTRTVDIPQAECLAAVERAGYQPSGFSVSDLERHSHQAAYAMPSARCEANAAHLARVADFPTLAVDEDAEGWTVRTHAGRFACASAQAVFDPGLRTPATVPEIIRYSPQTPERTILGDALTVLVSAAVAEGRTRWRLDDVVDATLDRPIGIRRLYHASVRQRVTNVLRTGLPSGAEHELAGFLGRLHGQADAQFELLSDGQRPSAAWLRRLREATAQWLNRVGQGRPVRDQYVLPLDPGLETRMDHGSDA